MIYVISFFVTFFYVFAKAFQQRNVAFDKYAAILPVSMIMAAGEYIIVAIIGITVVNHGVSEGAGLIVANGFGGGLGAICAIILHKKVFNVKA